MAFQTGQAELVVASYDAQEASSGTVPPAPPDDSSVPDIGYKASVDKNPPGILLSSVSGDAVLSINGWPIKVRKQPAFCLSEIQGDCFLLTTGAQKFPDIVHVSAWLVLWWKLLQRD
jgi:hypothetical protein